MNQLFWALFVRREPSFVYAFKILLDFEVLVVVSRWDVLLLIWNWSSGLCGWLEILFVPVLQDASTDTGPSSVSPIVDMSALTKVNEAGTKTITYLRSQISNLQQRLKQVQGLADVAVSKQRLAAERENYLIEELGKAAKDLLCK